MRLLADEHIAKDVLDFLVSAGHDVVSVAHVLSGATDLEVFLYAKEEERVILTLDADFGNVLRFPLTEHAGILLMRTKNVQPTVLIHLLKQAFCRLTQERLKGKLVVATHTHMRIYPSDG